MLIAYILNNSRFLKWKIIRNREQGTFMFKGREYNINRERIYTKKILFIKLIFWSMYFEGRPDPIEFTEKGLSCSVSDVPLDEIAHLYKKIMKSGIEIITLILSAFSLIFILMVLMKVYNYVQ